MNRGTPPAAPRILSIAGTDPTGGAGIHADLKSIAANGGYGMAVVTALVAQNTRGVRSIHVPPVGFLAEQLRAVSDDVEIDAVKIGMLFDREIVDTVRDWLETVRPPIVVLDPVMVATSGDRLLGEAAESALRDILPLVDLVTPNRPELAALLDEAEAETWEQALAQARLLAEGHGVSVLAKGGHFNTAAACDALVDAATGSVTEYPSHRVRTRHTHGTGCSLSSAVATLRARRGSWGPAIAEAKRWLTESLEAADGLRVGAGNGPVSHFAGLWDRAGDPVAPEHVAAAWWEGIRGIRDATDDLPFLRGLADGTLGAAAFRWYLAQDALYLRDYARVLAHASALAPTSEEQTFWSSSAAGAIAAELELHSRWLSTDGLFDAAPSPTTTAYIDHLLALAARGDYGALVAGVLPCFWMYVDIGERLLPAATPENPYTAWIETYADPAFRAATDRAIDIVFRHAAGASVAARGRMRDAFVVSAQHERAFFAAPLALSSPERAPRRAP
ncbi:bifunctional hydroxymethylpyrimidine kinase/phosphomethylpyrimidine kinase [Microbacterium sp. SORGH_AS_0888]|uniref:bifunctional hydroxymethylpyrimidine kinase/phosphomethylpyrimidine kinase n=1 Tax=Microbacterium sp. SORGH_AS_0888 TaxID=3041791 RepID=UPI00277EAB36|nr:bifunctional hydroxymethylpyrimidine kinase/phosphomethylpyrimidine kinase [Microbacterium sp. SORGH_AS_0888]MDQ1128349.1 hydroxymethylpyrimidine/phosphomethylpyrimidine kinase [Microbacterium sp. SORGH_AS_0888]